MNSANEDLTWIKEVILEHARLFYFYADYTLFDGGYWRLTTA